MHLLLRLPLLAGLLLMATVTPLRSQTDSAVAPASGLSSQGKHPDKPYVTAGDRAYLIGTQDGRFPDMGDHLPGEMAGGWLHPIKLIDGFRASLTDSATGRRAILSASTDFVTYPYGNRLRYGAALDSLEVERFEFSPDGREGLIVQYQIRNTGGRRRTLDFELAVKTDLRPVWFSDSLGITDAPDTAGWDPESRIFVARDTGHPWFCVWGATPEAGAEPVTNPDSIETQGSGVTTAAR